MNLPTNKIDKLFNKFKCCVIIPTYNNATKIEGVIKDVLQYTNNIIVVNDGSTDKTNDILKKYSSLHVIAYRDNKGKGYALRKGFRFAEEIGFEFAITIDSDGQHFAKDLLVFIEKLKKEKNAIIIGTRKIEAKKQSKGSSFANKFSNFWFKLETGIKHNDTQSGYRLYPLITINKKKYFSNRYEFEIEVIVRAAWRGIDILSVPVNVYYPRRSESISHFRPFKDFFRISVLNTILIITALFYGLPARFKHKIKKKSLKKAIKENILQSNDSNARISVAIAFGVFMGIIPIWGWQLITAIALAYVFKLNKPIVIIAANISIPPMIPFILFGSFYTGAIVLDNDLDFVHLNSFIDFEIIKKNILQYITGACVFASITGIFFGILSFFILNFFRKK